MTFCGLEIPDFSLVWSDGKVSSEFLCSLLLSYALDKVLKRVKLADCDKNCNFSGCEMATQDFTHKSFRWPGLKQEKQSGHASFNPEINQKQNLNYDAAL